MKRKHIIALCALTAAAVLGAAAGTGAYLTHRTAETVNTFAVGQLEAELTEPEWDKLPDEAKVLYPGKTVAKDPTACNAAESTTAAYMYLQVEIPRASVRTYTIAETAKADGSDETNQEPTSGAGVLDNGGEPHTVDLVSFQPNDGWSLLEETETEETHTFIYRPRPAAKRARTPAGRSGAQDRAGGTRKNANRFCRPAAARQQRNPKGGVGFFSNIVIKIEGSGSHAVIKRAQTRLCGLLLLLAFRCNSQ